MKIASAREETSQRDKSGMNRWIGWKCKNANAQDRNEIRGKVNERKKTKMMKSSKNTKTQGESQQYGMVCLRKRECWLAERKAVCGQTSKHAFRDEQIT